MLSHTQAEKLDSHGMIGTFFLFWRLVDDDSYIFGNGVAIDNENANCPTTLADFFSSGRIPKN